MFKQLLLKDKEKVNKIILEYLHIYSPSINGLKNKFKITKEEAIKIFMIKHKEKIENYIIYKL